MPRKIDINIIFKLNENLYVIELKEINNDFKKYLSNLFLKYSKLDYRIIKEINEYIEIMEDYLYKISSSVFQGSFSFSAHEEYSINFALALTLFGLGLITQNTYISNILYSVATAEIINIIKKLIEIQKFMNWLSLSPVFPAIVVD